MGILIIRGPATPAQIAEMRQELGDVIKLAVDLERGILAGGSDSKLLSAGDYFFYRPGYQLMDATRVTVVDQALLTKNTYEFYKSLKQLFPNRMN